MITQYYERQMKIGGSIAARMRAAGGLIIPGLCAILFMFGCLLLSAQDTARHVVVFGVDGLEPQGIDEAKTPNIHAMMKDGSWSFHARAVFPTVSSPNWASMIMGAPVEMTGVISNAWEPNSATIAPACEDAPGIFPTIFGLEHRQHPMAKMGIFTDWADFVRLVEPGVVGTVYTTNEDEDSVFAHALEYLKRQKPEFLFIHLDLVDHAGHTYGWGSPQYLRAVEKTDYMLGALRNALESMQLLSSTTVFLTADHGGVGKGHGGLTMVEMEVPWIVTGPGIRKDHEITDTIMQYDTAATLAVVLDVKPSSCWRATPVSSAFDPAWSTKQ